MNVRDVVEVTMDLGGYRCIISDTAGLRTESIDMIELEGMRRARYCIYSNTNSYIIRVYAWHWLSYIVLLVCLSHSIVSVLCVTFLGKLFKRRTSNYFFRMLLMQAMNLVRLV